METAIRDLEEALNARFAAVAERMPGPVPAHRVEFSKRITQSWALIYFRRNLIRLSPYVFLLEPHELKHVTYEDELDATIKHEVVHAHLYARDRTREHSPEFHALLRGLGVNPNGELDLGPTNVAFRYLYACPSCKRSWKRRVPIKGNWSCGTCSRGKYSPEHRMTLVQKLPHPWEQLAARRDLVEETTRRIRERTAAERDDERAPVSLAGPAIVTAGTVGQWRSMEGLSSVGTDALPAQEE